MVVFPIRPKQGLCTLWLLATAVLLQMGCASKGGMRAPQARASESPTLVMPMLQVHMQGGTAVDEVVVQTSAVEALEVAQRWGVLRELVTLRVHPSHAALESAAHQSNVPWMRGWARFDEVELEAPSRWGGDRVPDHVTELLSHELTHVVMYQRVSDRDAWTRVNIPLWFREGMASVTSRQGYRRMTGEQLGTWLRAHPGDDPWLQADALAHGHQPVVYGAAHRAFERLIARHGDDAVHRILDGLKAQHPFEAAFEQAAGHSPVEFLAQFRRELEDVRVWQPAPGPTRVVAAAPSWFSARD